MGQAIDKVILWRESSIKTHHIIQLSPEVEVTSGGYLRRDAKCFSVCQISE